ncbi:uncharacterized protein BYT42DRAFT_7575 [Radiomyces spectabilis]|uniref:uncharacterized protein n=1 Tax=Radiomyces spectabilis TaxID=64574 RepID=UPI00221EB6F2|nr:uncharacterized protein BYT42DRAFT_7575 [Radiomyces spectabilis]KAI8393466.1 hypothetical protein BYT42DRAFT_7575 [Radiomyces spectabilis]
MKWIPYQLSIRTYCAITSAVCVKSTWHTKKRKSFSVPYFFSFWRMASVLLLFVKSVGQITRNLGEHRSNTRWSVRGGSIYLFFRSCLDRLSALLSDRSTPRLERIDGFSPLKKGQKKTWSLKWYFALA